MNSQNLSVGALAAGVMIAMGAVVPTAPAVAQDAGNQLVLEEVIVTANKREQSLQDVAQTVNVVTGEVLDDLQIRSFQEISTTVAGLSLSRVSGGEQSASMRGIKMDQPRGANGQTNTVEMYMNEVPITAQDSFNSMFDIGQVEVLRGPQGTLRGRPSPSGAITIAPRLGSFEEADGYIQIGATDNGGANLQAAWGGPLSDRVSLRLAGIHDESDDNGIRSLGNGKHSYHESLGLRATLGWAPTDRFELLVMHQYNDHEQDFYRGISGTSILPESVAYQQTFTFQDKISLNQENPSTYEADLTTITATYSWDNFEFNYVGGYKDANFLYTLDFDFAGVGGAPWLVIENDNQSTTNEFRFESTGGEVYNFTVGVFTGEYESSGGGAFLFTPRPLQPGQINNNPYALEDTGVFMNHTIDFGANNTLTFGTRRSEYKVDRAVGPDVKYTATTGNASIQHRFTNDVMGYITFGKSFRPGTGGANTTQQPVPDTFVNYDKEESTSTEIGVKAQFDGGRYTLNVAYYDQQYDGFIAVTNGVACTGVPNPNGLAFATVDGTATGENCRVNASFNGDAVSEGIDLEFRALITENWTLGFNYAHVDAHFDNSLVPCNDYNGDGNIDNEGQAQIQPGQFLSMCRTSEALGALSPNSLSLMTSYEFNIGNLGAYVRANGFYNDEAFFPQTGLYLPSDPRVNAYFGITGPDRQWEVSLWAKNLFDKVVQDNDGGNWFVAGQPSGLALGSATLGREIGVNFRRDF